MSREAKISASYASMGASPKTVKEIWGGASRSSRPLSSRARFGLCESDDETSGGSDKGACRRSSQTESEVEAGAGPGDSS